jgi:hypothetical protein
MAAMVAVANKGGLMEPLTKITLGGSEWLGVLAIACTVAGELLSLADSPTGQRTSFVHRENIRRAVGRSPGRSR